ncbi:hypothetical protein RFN29_15680 [Mesorhizobium sp. VK22B]|uniref:Uncharacterized protein n=1 Tax=Mesorhizobium captivum TaxID=3072319 RepID=A0ABU4Z1A8_9HYPH|nr:MULTISPECIES: hypothetical protein [unclassified Mesorhizobium]MDX8493018.1 hypothetical protein [Mesorhizobium sp. VK22B]MDX8509771.1 hypothetical protein [Mesorhizobium sp. VK22E]
MRMKLPVWPSPRPFLLVMQSMLLVGIASVAAGPAQAADDCSSFRPYACLRESISNAGAARELAATVLRHDSTIDYFNIIIPGRAQGRLEPGGTFTLTVPNDGKAVYSIQECRPKIPGLPHECSSWTQIVRQFAPLQPPAAQAQPCPSGYVWRDNFDGDTLCVKPELRHKLADGTCRAGYVWRDSFDGDAVCVTPAERAAAKAAASQPPMKPIKTTGKGGSGGAGNPTPGGVLSCQGGGGMQVTVKDETGVFVAFNHASQPANAAPPGPGQCAWADRLFAPNEQHRLAFNPNQPNGQQLLQAVQGGTFQVKAVPMTAFIMVKAINNVQVMDSTPLSPGAANANGSGSGGTPQTPADMGGPPPMQQADGTCGGGNAMATVVINQPGLDKLNVRSGPGGQVVGTVPEGGTASVIGPCGAISGAAGFTKPKTQQGGGGGGAGGWCQISAPVHGCVSSQFLAFGGSDAGTNISGGAAGFAKSKARPQASAPTTAGFSGRWAANADNVAYSLSLRQKGSGVSGNYQGSDGSAGTISGKMNGNILRFAWVQRDGTKGSGKFMLADDGQSFNGSYSFGSNPDAVEGRWNGTRQ